MPSPVRRSTTGRHHPLGVPAGVAMWTMELPAHTQEAGPGLEGLHQLSLQGRWREVVNRCRSFTATDTAAALSVSAFHVLALTKLKMYGDALAELAKLGELDDPQYLSSKSHGAVSLVPFALRWMQAELPGLAGQVEESFQAMYSLMGWCQQQREAVVAAGGDPELWQERQRRAAFTLAGKHVRLKQHRAALAVLNLLLKEHAEQPEVWSQVGRVQLSLGDVAAAQHSFERAAAAAAALVQQHLQQSNGASSPGAQSGLPSPASPSMQQAQQDAGALSPRVQQPLLPIAQQAAGGSISPGGQRQQLSPTAQQGGGTFSPRAQRPLSPNAHRLLSPRAYGRWGSLLEKDRALLLFAQQDFRAALEQFEAVLRMDPGDAEAANNRALCAMYAGDLGFAVRSLEASFAAAPEHLLQEVPILNLASMYDLSASGPSQESKQKLADWVAANAPDDLDLACTKAVA